MRIAPRRLLSCLIVSVVLVSPAVASVLRPLALAELTADADRIVLGSVLSTQSTWDAPHRTIYSTVEIGVEESWKGAIPANGRLRVRHVGGVVGDIEMTVHGEARFQPGERVVVFARGGRLVGMGQGKKHLAWDSGAKRWMAAPWDHSGTRLAGPLDSTAEGTTPLETLRAQVRALVQP